MATPPEPSSSDPASSGPAKPAPRAARHRLAKPQPKKDDTAPAQNPPPDPVAGSTSGFVGMLAKGQFGHPLGPTAGPPKHPPGKYRVPMAREIVPNKSPPAAFPTTPPVRPAATPPERAQVPSWFHRLLPAVLTLAAIMLLIGVWAVGGLLYMARVVPTSSENVHYPLIRWSPTVGDLGGYTPGSIAVAWTLALCLPVSLALLLILWKLSRTRHAFQ